MLKLSKALPELKLLGIWKFCSRFLVRPGNFCFCRVSTPTPSPGAAAATLANLGGPSAGKSFTGGTSGNLSNSQLKKLKKAAQKGQFQKSDQPKGGPGREWW